MRKSFFFKLILLIILFGVVIRGIFLYVLYKNEYVNTMNRSKNMIYLASEMAEQTLMIEDLGDFEFSDKVDDKLSEICVKCDITYLYAVELNDDGVTLTYRAIGVGPNANKKYKKERHRGDVVYSDQLDDAMRSVYSKKDKFITEHYKNKFDDNLASYRYLDQKYNTSTNSYEEVSNPLIIGAEVSISTVMRNFIKRFMIYSLIIAAFSWAIIITVVLIIRRRVSRPVRRISSRMDSFVSDRDKEFEPLPVKGHDEFATMSRSFNSMAGQIDEYLSNIEEMTREKHTREAELSVAKNIQLGLLKPGSSSNENVSVYAYMRTATEVGGDLYDYNFLDDGRIYITIGDVSGKGITAALFMARAITLLHQFSDMGYSPSKLLTMFNKSLVERNPEELFITTFIAVYDPADHSFTYSNAGHDFPYIISNNKLIKLDQVHSFAAGIMEDEEYYETTLILKENDVVFLYTDGVNVAMTEDGNQYGKQRIEDKLTGLSGKTGDKITQDILNDIESFVDGAEQSDDLTILTMRVI
ncbi:MAG: SpoIIE family protein phosphatase [Eubacterium sp.]|nr:SpoIIE family protein phosphatase [Eubacterium sp.]